MKVDRALCFLGFILVSTVVSFIVSREGMVQEMVNLER